MWNVYLVDTSIGERAEVADVVTVEYEHTAYAVCNELEPYLVEGIKARIRES
jgi:hypothetical protein